MLNQNAINKFIQATNLNQITNKTDLAMFLAQCDHESQGFTVVRENLNYSSDALLSMFSDYFSTDDSNLYGRTQQHPANQEAIANIIYANRMGNGDVDSGDGWMYRGGGYMQLTGRRMYTNCGIALKLDFLNNPALICQPQNAMNSAIWFWQTNNCGGHGDDVVAVTRIINGGLNGIEQRQELFDDYVQLLQQI